MTFIIKVFIGNTPVTVFSGTTTATALQLYQLLQNAVAGDIFYKPTGQPRQKINGVEMEVQQ